MKNTFSQLFKLGKPKTRIAPTPSGYLHLGNGLSFLYTWLLARKLGGTIQLRIDDIDSGRVRQNYLDDIFEQLRWLGIDWDEGPSNSADFLQNYSQQQRLPLYQKHLLQLKENKLLFSCTCSRSHIKSHSVNGLYPGTCRALHLPFDLAQSAWRMQATTAPIHFDDLLLGPLSIRIDETMGDFVIRKKDKKPAYQLVSLAEDIKAGTNLIVRGADLLTSTAAQHYIAQQLGNSTLAQALFIHHPLLLDQNGNKLSKSDGAPALRSMRERSPSPSLLHQQCAQWLGIAESIDSLQQLLEQFDPLKHFPR